MKVFVVIGSTGEYSDRTEWFVAAFRSEKNAKKRVTLASTAARICCQWCNDELESWTYTDREDKPKNPHDPAMQICDGALRYSYAAVELLP